VSKERLISENLFELETDDGPVPLLAAKDLVKIRLVKAVDQAKHAVIKVQSDCYEQIDFWAPALTGDCVSPHPWCSGSLVLAKFR
jgi:hypothetical protein